MIWKANPKIVNVLEERGALFAKADHVHSYMHCWRHKTPVILRATVQWFAGMDEVPGYKGVKPAESLRATALRGVEKTQFYPAWGRARLHGMIANRPDWTLSRQRQWGVPMPFFIHKETGTLHPRTLDLLEQVAKRVERSGIEAWQSLEAEELLGDDAENYAKVRTRSTSGSIPARPISRCCAARTRRRPGFPPTSTWKAPTSTAAGSIPRCWSPP
jgi:isoleucyl-tRNA synthetase